MENKQHLARLLFAAAATSSASSAIWSWLSSAQRLDATVADLAELTAMPVSDLEFNELPEARDRSFFSDQLVIAILVKKLFGLRLFGLEESHDCSLERKDSESCGITLRSGRASEGTRSISDL